MPRRELEPGAPVPVFFGAELRRYRKLAGLSQEELGERVGCTGALVGMVETALRMPGLQLTVVCDRVLGTGGSLARLWPLLHRYPALFQGYVELEVTASVIASFSAQAVPDLFQTGDYARALLQAACWAEDVEQRVAARVERQRILEHPSPLLVWAVLDEAVLRRPVGGREVMREQLKRLVGLADSRRVVVQVLPFSAGAHACMNGSTTILSFTDGDDVVYAEGAGSGQLISQSDDVQDCRLKLDLAKAVSLSPAASLEMIKVVMEDL